MRQRHTHECRICRSQFFCEIGPNCKLMGTDDHPNWYSRPRCHRSDCRGTESEMKRERDFARTEPRFRNG